MPKTTTSVSALRRVMPDDSLSIMDMLMLCLRHWPWFILSVALFMGGATLYLLRTPKTYTRTASVLVKSSGSKSNDIRLIEDLGVNNITSNISDEIVAIHSPAVVYDLVKRLHLDFSYFRPGSFRDEPLYAETLPVEVELHDLDDNASASFRLTLGGDGTATLSDPVLRGEALGGSCRVKVGTKCKTPLGAVTVTPTLYYKKDARATVLVRRTGYVAAAGRYGALTVDYPESGIGMSERCARHLTALFEFCRAYDGPAGTIDPGDVPGYKDILTNGIGAYLASPK